LEKAIDDITQLVRQGRHNDAWHLLKITHEQQEEIISTDLKLETMVRRADIAWYC
jgi:hypothetical protein